jgi:hypothetical protein
MGLLSRRGFLRRAGATAAVAAAVPVAAVAAREAAPESVPPLLKLDAATGEITPVGKPTMVFLGHGRLIERGPGKRWRVVRGEGATIADAMNHAENI